MEAALGIDFGTTNSTVCLYDGTDYHFVDLEDGKPTIPSLMYVDKQYYPTYGESARTRFLGDNRNRRIELGKTDLGYIEITVGEDAFESFEGSPFSPVPTTFDARISALTDQNLPGFLFASTKRLLGQNAIGSVKLFDKDIKLEAVVSSIIQNIHGRIRSEHVHFAETQTCVGRPVNYECSSEDDQNECNALAIARMDKALGYAGIREYGYFLEPIAPMLTHLHENEEEENQDLLVLDFGGGTLDLSILRKRDRRLRVVGNFGRALGGDIITEQLVKDYVFPRMGLSQENIATLKSQHNHLGDIVPDILNWRRTYMLHQPKYFTQITDAGKLHPQDAGKLNRIRLLIVQNFAYNVSYALENAKKRLSESLQAEVALQPIGISFTLSRSDLERSMSRYLAAVESSIRSFCSANGYELARIGRVILTGGTSLIPCIRRLVESMFPDKVLAIDPFMSVAKGFALGAWLQGQNRISLNGKQVQIDLE